MQLVDAYLVLLPQNYSRSTPLVKYSSERQEVKRSGAEDGQHDVHKQMKLNVQPAVEEGSSAGRV